MTDLQKAAEALRTARANRVAIPPISTSFGICELKDAYAVAEINTSRMLSDSARRVVGKKVGLTSRAVQQQLGVDQPDFGVLFDNMEFLNGSDVPMSRLIQPKVEAEIAFVVGKQLSSENPSWSEFVSSIEYVLPAIEIVDSAIQDWKISLADTVADNASSALYVLGDQPSLLGKDDLSGIGMEMTSNGHVVSIGSGAACLGHPLRAAYWLVRTMASLNRPLHEGEIILSGALGPMVAVQSGTAVNARIGNLGSVSCQFQ